MSVLVLALILGGVIVPMSAATGPGTRGPSSSAARIIGAAWNADSQPVPSAKLRLRNVLTGKIAATAVADATGRFTFEGIEGSSYVIELVSDAGRVLALGHTFSVAPGETVATFVRLGAKAPWLTGFFSNAAAATVSAASSVGVTALGSSGIPASSQR